MNNYKKLTAAALAAALALTLFTGCASSKADESEVSDEVTRILLENANGDSSDSDDQTESSANNGSDSTGKDGQAGGNSSDGSLDAASNGSSSTNSDGTSAAASESDLNKSDSANTSTDANTSDKVTTGKVEDNKSYVVNPFVGYNSTATSYDIKFAFETDSGVAGFTWGFTDDADPVLSSNGNRITNKKTSTPGSDYFLWAIDMTRDFPILYTSRRQIDASTGKELVYDEESTNLDMMYPEMSMFTGTQHYIEIKVDGTTVTTFLDSVQVNTKTLAAARPIGQIGTWVQTGNYHAYFDDLFIAEGVNGDGDYLYSEDFSGKTNIFNPYLKNKDGRLYAKAGLYMVPRTE